MKYTVLGLGLAAYLVSGCDLFIEEYVPPSCEGGNLNEFDDLCWQDPYEDITYTYSEAISICDALDQADHNDWRLPYLQEFLDLFDDCGNFVIGEDEISCGSCGDSSYCDGLFGGQAGLFWSVIETGDTSLGFAVINITEGYVNYVELNHPGRVRCVRP